MKRQEEIKKHQDSVKQLKEMSDKEFEIFKIESDPEFDRWVKLYAGSEFKGYIPMCKRNMLVEVYFPEH